MKKRHAFITGIAGFAGSYLAEELLRAGYQVSGSLLENESTKYIAHIEKELNLVTLDILDLGSCQAMLQKLRPDYVYHLAAIASVGRSFDQESLTFAVNFHGTLNMLGAAQPLKRLKRFLFVSSAECYGIFGSGRKTLTEAQPLNPISPYGIAKAAAEQASLYYFRQHRLPVVVARSFNHSGPRQSDKFVIPAFASQIAMIEAGLQKPVLSVGDLNARRDFSDVRDIVRGYRLISEKSKPGEVYQLCSGRAVSIKQMLDRLISIANRDIIVKRDPAKVRKTDLPLLRGSYRKAAQAVGYSVRYKLRQTLTDTLDYWRGEMPGDQ